MTATDTPNWEPLERLLGAELTPLFMWMGSHTHRTGAVLHAYKHLETRRTLHLDAQLRAYVYGPSGRYQPVHTHDALHAVLEPWLSGPTVTAEQAAAYFDALARTNPKEQHP